MTQSVEDLRLLQHRVFTTAAETTEALRRGAANEPRWLSERPDVSKQITRLRIDVDELFRAEETAMDAYSFHDSQSHEIEHAWMRTVLAEVEAGAHLAEKGQIDLSLLAARFQRDFVAPMLNHSQTLDREMLAFLRKRQR